MNFSHSTKPIKDGEQPSTMENRRLNKASIDNSLNEIELQLKNTEYGYTFYLTGRAATALLYAYLSIKKIKKKIIDPEIILPAFSCSTPSNTALMCGLIPRFADISETTALVTLNEIKKKHTPQTVAVLFIHLFGNTADLWEIKKWCEEKDVFLIEDVAQSLGGIMPDGKLSGTTGDFVVYSFNKTKIIETGGGALSVRTKNLIEVTSAIIEKCKFTENTNHRQLSELSMSYRNLHHSLVSLKRLNPSVNISKGFLSIRDNYNPLFFEKSVDAITLAADFRTLQDKLKSRIVKARIYAESVSQNRSFTMLDGWTKSGCCWRFSFLIDKPDLLTDFSELLRNDGFHVSNLYWPVNHFFNPNDICNSANNLARRIINLWVNEEVSEDWVKRCSISIDKNSKIFK